MKYFKIVLEQPTAHYGRDISISPSRSYPIPPYSTVIGMFVNALGIKINTDEKYKQLRSIKLSIAGYYQAKRMDYRKYRVLAKKGKGDKLHNEIKIAAPHKDIEHFGDPLPIEIEVLHNVHLVIHVAHEDESFLQALLNSIIEQDRASNPLHLGRGEDIFAVRNYSKDIKDVTSLDIISKMGRFISKIHKDQYYQFWIPEHIYLPEQIKEDFVFQKVKGALMKIGTFTHTVNYDTQNLKASVESRRIVFPMRVKLSDFTDDSFEFFYDKEENVPVMFADFSEINKIKLV